MQNTMVRGDREWPLEKKIIFRGKNERGERKTDESYIKNDRNAQYIPLPCPAGGLALVHILVHKIEMLQNIYK